MTLLSWPRHPDPVTPADLGTLIELSWWRHSDTPGATTSDAWARVATDILDHLADTGAAPHASSGGARATDPLPSATTPPDDHHARHIDAQLEQLAQTLALAAGTLAGTDQWRLAAPAYQETYRRLAAQVALAGWRPPADPRRAGRIATIARVLTDHELLVDGVCRCGWAGAEMWHAEHQAGHLLSVGAAR